MNWWKVLLDARLIVVLEYYTQQLDFKTECVTIEKKCGVYFLNLRYLSTQRYDCNSFRRELYYII